MITFCTYMTHPRTMADLDKARLNKQRLETLQILRALRGEIDAWQTHPAVQMWAGYEPALVLYGLFVCHEWRIVRGFDDNIWGDLAKYAKEYGMLDIEPELSKKGRAIGVLPGQEVENPPWLTDKWVLRSHRSRLMAKAEHIYGQKYDGTPWNMPYLWPVIDSSRPDRYTLRVTRADLARLDSGERELPEGLSIDGQTVTPA